MKRELLERMSEFRKNEEETLKEISNRVNPSVQLNKLKNDKTVSVSEYVSEEHKEEETTKRVSTDNVLNQQRKNVSLPLETYIKLNEIKIFRFQTQQEFVSLTSLVKEFIEKEYARLGLTKETEE